MQQEAVPMSRFELRAFAKTFRDAMGISDDKSFPIVEVFEKLLCALEYALELVQDKDMPDNYAITIPSQSLVRIRESVYLNAISGSTRDRFTIAHEIAHLLFHDNLTVSFARNAGSIPAYQNPEWQANTFAAELLVPHQKIIGMSVADIMTKYGVSKKVAQIQSSYTKKIPA